MKFTFNSKFVGFGSPSSTLEFEADALSDVLERFGDFLRGSGYHFDGYIDIVPHDEELIYEEEDDEYEIEQSKQRWAATVNSLMNPPKFRANSSGCEVCGLNKEMMKSHNCYDDNCPIHAPQSVCTSEE